MRTMSNKYGVELRPFYNNNNNNNNNKIKATNHH